MLTASIQARLGSTRLPGKVMYHLGNRRVIEWVVDRCRTAETVDEVVLAPGDAAPNAALRSLAERRGWRCIPGPEDDLLERHRRVADDIGCDRLVRITGDCPFVPPSEVDRVVEAHERGGDRYTTNVTDSMPVGTAVDVLDAEVLDDLAAEGATHPVARLRDDPERWGTRFTDSPDWTAWGEAHTAVDTPDDYWRLIDAVEAVGTDPCAVTEHLAADR